MQHADQSSHLLETPVDHTTEVKHILAEKDNLEKTLVITSKALKNAEEECELKNYES